MHPKVLEALTATRALGIPDEEVKPVLKRLLNLYDKKWELIEEDSYRTLIDAYFDRKDDKETGNRRRTSPGKDDFERPPKRQQSQSEKLNSKVQAVSSDDDTVSTSSKEIEVLEPLSTDANSSSLHSDKKKEHVSSPLMVVKTEKIPQGVPSSILLKNLMGEKGSSQKRGEDGPSNHQSRQLIVPKTERMENSPYFSEPKKVGSSVCPAPSENSSHGDCLVRSVASSYRDMKKRDYSAMNGDCSSSKGNIDVASSSQGEVKMSLNCNSALRQRNFQIPKLDAVLKFVEENYLKAYNVEPRFSVARLLKDLCQAFLKLGSNCHGKLSSSKSDTQCATKVSGAMVGPNKRQLQIGDSEGQMISKSTGSAYNGLVVAERRSKPCEKKYAQNVADITKGAENVKIALVHDTSVENLPSFNYIPHNIIYQNAHVQFSLARISDEDCCPSCSGNCLSSTLPCICASETGGEFAYTAKGQLKEEFLEACISRKTNPEKQHFFYCHDCPEERTKNEYMPEKCKGHLLRKFIKECWRKCGCDMQCDNRVVQRGITCKLQVFWTRDGKGWGVRTVEDLPKGTFVCEYIGEIVTNIELYNRNMQSDGNERHTYPVTLDADWGSEGILQDEDALCLDATYHGNVARFINHRCFDANLIDIPVEIETPDRHYYHDYAIDFDDHDHPVKAFQCCCRSQYCRDKNRRDTRRP